MNFSANSRGQALLLVLLSTAVVVTIALSIISRTISDVAVTTTEEESLRAFSAAEAGIEEVLVSGLGEGASTGDVVVNNPGTPETVTYNVSITGFPESASEFIYPVDLASGESATVWLMSHDSSGNLTCDNPHTCYSSSRVDICWGPIATPTSPSQPSAAEISILYQDTATSEIRTARVVIDPTGTIPGAEPADGGYCTIAGTYFAYGKRIHFNVPGLNIPNYNIPGTLKLIKIRPLMNASPQTIAIHSAGTGGSFPSQGKKIQSTGNSGESLRKIEVYELYPSMPSLFDAAIYGKTGIIK